MGDSNFSANLVFDKLAELESQLGRSAEIALSIRRDIASGRGTRRSSWPSAGDQARSSPASQGGAETESLKADLAERTCEIATLTLLVGDAEMAHSKCAKDFEWLRNCTMLLLKQPAWWGIMPRAWRDRRIHVRFAKHGLFDADKYLQRYPDVATARMDPLLHYISHGFAEGRDR